MEEDDKRPGAGTKKRGQNSVICSLRSSTTYAAKYTSKAHARGVSVLALLLAANLKVSKFQRSKNNSLTLFQYVQDARTKSCSVSLHRQSFQGLTQQM